MNSTTTDIAHDLIRAGLSIIPIKDKVPSVNWKKYQTRRPEIGELNYNGQIGLVCGPVSGVEVVDIDSKNCPGRDLLGDLDKTISEFCPGIIEKLVCQSTPSGGAHLIYKCEYIEGNQPLARSKDGKVLIETRGSGGYVAIAPTPGYCIKYGNLVSISTITRDERDDLLSACRALNELPEVVEAKKFTTTSTDLPPWEDYNQRGEVDDLLQLHGWRYLRKNGDNLHYCRPGKEGGTSATWSESKKLFYVFTSSSQFEPSKAYPASAVFACLETNKDFSEAARKLREMGYGQATKIKERTKEVTIFRLTKPTSMERPKKIFGSAWAQNELAYLFGEDGSCKTIVAVQIGCATATGISIPGFPNELPAQPVTYFDAELSDYQFNTRYPGGLPENFKRFTFDEEQQAALINADIEFVVEQIERAAESQGSKIIILDNLSALASMLDLTKTQESVRLMGLLNDLKRKGYSVLVIDHTRKPMHEVEFKTIYKGDLQGSKMKSNLADSVFSIGKSCQGENIRYIKALKIRSFEMTLTTKGVATMTLRTDPLRLDFLSIDPEWQHVNSENFEIHKGISAGMTQKEIAEKIGLSQQAVSKRLHRV